MDDVISLGVGEPDFDTPRTSSRRAWPASCAGRTHYTSNYGTIELRRALAAHLDGRYGVQYDPATEILVTVGASEAVDLALRATCDPGDEVIVHEPSYVAYVPAIAFAGGSAVRVATRFEDDFALDPAAVEAAITPRTKALFLGYPCNPTGAVLPDAVQDELAAIAVRHDLLVYSDEIYDRLAYGSYHHRALSGLPGMRERTILIGGFSKAYAMTGWRVGYLCAPAGDPRGHRQGPPVRDHVGPDHRPGRRARGAPPRRVGRAADGGRVRPPAAAAGRRAERDRAADVRAAGRLLRLPRGDLDTGLTSDAVHRAAAPRGAGRGRPGQRLRGVRRGARPDVLRHRLRPARGGAPPDRPVRRARPERGRGPGSGARHLAAARPARPASQCQTSPHPAVRGAGAAMPNCPDGSSPDRMRDRDGGRRPLARVRRGAPGAGAVRP